MKQPSLLVFLLATAAQVARGDGSCGAKGGGGGQLGKEELFKVHVVNKYSEKVRVYWDEQDTAIKTYFRGGRPTSQLVAEFYPDQMFEFNVNSGQLFYVQDDHGKRTCSIVIVPGVDEYELVPGAFEDPPWGSAESNAKSMFAAVDEDKDKLLSSTETSKMMERLEKVEGIKAKIAMAALDKDGDGGLTWEEVEAFFLSIMSQEMHVRARQHAGEKAPADSRGAERELDGFRALLMGHGGGGGGGGGCANPPS